MTTIFDQAADAPALPLVTDPLPDRWDRYHASLEATRIQLDSWQRTQRMQRELAEEIYQSLEDRVPNIRELRPNGQGYSYSPPRVPLMIMDATAWARHLRDQERVDPEHFGNLPMSPEEFDAEITRRLQAEFGATQDVLSMGPEGGWLPELAGSFAAGATDEATVATLPLGAPAGLSVLGTIALEATMAATAEYAMFDRQVAMADRLETDRPNLATNMLVAGLTGGAFAGVATGGARYIQIRREARAAQAEQLDTQTDLAIGDAAERLHNGEDLEDVMIGLEISARQQQFMAGQSENARGAFERLQAAWPEEIQITSAFRDPDHNRLVGGASASQHLHGNAFDINTSGMSRDDVIQFITAAREAGFTGFGIYNDGASVHFDTGPARAWGNDRSHRTVPDWAWPAIRGETEAATPIDALVNAIIRVESSGDPNASATTSSALGLGQFISDTWMDMIARHRPELMEGRSRAEILALRTDPELSREMTRALLEENAAGLTGAGFDPTPGNVYLAHFAGLDGALRVLRADPSTPIASILSRAAIRANAAIRHNGRPFAQFTASDLMAWASSRMRRAGGSQPAGTPQFTTSRGYTSAGQVAAGPMRVDVDYEVVDASLLRQAEGELQPRDRSRGASDEQVAEIAARLDPARLLPSPEADRGAPIVGPDGIIESGNGRVLAIQRAAELHPDRMQAYVEALRQAGFAVPEDAQVPVLVGRRTSDLSQADRQRFVAEANSSAVARMSPSERARADASMIDRETVSLYDPAFPISARQNRPFVQRALAQLPQAERNALFDADGALNVEGIRRLQTALFARAFDARDLLARYAETDAGELRSLMVALERAAPAWARLRSDIEAGLIRPEMDISGHFMEALRIIATARELARAGDTTVSRAIQDLISDVDLLDGVLSPLTQALLSVLWRGNRAASADDVASLMTRYAAEAQRIGTTEPGLFGDAPGPLDALRAIDADAFGHLTEIGRVRGMQEPEVLPEIEVVADLPAGTFDDPAVPIARGAEGPDTAALREEIGEELLDMQIKTEDGDVWSARQLLDEIDEDAREVAVLDACLVGRG